MKKNNESCPVCGSDSLFEYEDHVFKFKHGRKTHTVSGLSHSLCQECGVSMFLPDQMDRNNVLVKEFQKGLKDYISPEQVLELREIYNITQAQANIVFGGGPTAFSKYERGVSSPSAGAARQMLNALNNHAFMSQICQHHGIQIQGTQPVAPSVDPVLNTLPSALLARVQSYAVENALSINEVFLVLLAKGLNAEDDADRENEFGMHYSGVVDVRGRPHAVLGYRVESSLSRRGLSVPENPLLYGVIKKTNVAPAVVRMPRKN